MIVLDDTSSLSVIAVETGGAATHWEVSGVLVATTADTPITASGVITASNATMMAAPSAGQQKVIKNIKLRSESDAPGIGTVRVRVSRMVGATEYPIVSATLKAGQALVYEDGKGWSKIDIDGTPIVRPTNPNDNPTTKFHTQPWAKPSLGLQIVGSDTSFWRATGLPIQGGIPAAAAACSDTTAGAMVLATRSGSQKRRLRKFSAFAASVNQTFFLEDRLAHMGGLNGTLTTAQTVDLDLSLLGNNMAARKGADDYSEVEWFLEWYSTTGSTVATPTVNVTYADGTTGNCNVWVLGATALPASVGNFRRYQIISATGKGIKKVNSVTLSASTGTVGSFGVTAVRELCSVCSAVAYRETGAVFDKNNAPPIEDEACLTISLTTTATSTGVVNGTVVQDVSEV